MAPRPARQAHAVSNVMHVGLGCQRHWHLGWGPAHDYAGACGDKVYEGPCDLGRSRDGPFGSGEGPSGSGHSPLWKPMCMMRVLKRLTPPPPHVRFHPLRSTPRCNACGTRYRRTNQLGPVGAHTPAGRAAAAAAAAGASVSGGKRISKGHGGAAAKRNRASY